MKKGNFILMYIFILLIISLIIPLYLYNNEFKLTVKHFINKDFTINEMKNSELYKRYKKIKLKSSVEEVEKIMGKKGKEGNYPIVLSWKYPYGYISILYFSKDEIIHKDVVFYNFPRYSIDEKNLVNIKGITSFREVIHQLGKSIETGRDFNKEKNIMITEYTWKSKRKFSDYSFSMNTDPGYLLKISFSNDRVYEINKG